jgi:hypothetical protein
MNYTDVFLADLEREAPLSRRVLERVPDGKFDWKPAESSMPMGYLAIMVATMPEWLGMVIQMNELDIAPTSGCSARRCRRPMVPPATRNRLHPPDQSVRCQ